MNKDIGLGPAEFGFAGSIFFLGYMALGIPSNGLVRAQTGNFSIALMVVSGFLFISVLIAVLMRVAPKPIVPVADHGARA